MELHSTFCLVYYDWTVCVCIHLVYIYFKRLEIFNIKTHLDFVHSSPFTISTSRIAHTHTLEVIIMMSTSSTKWNGKRQFPCVIKYDAMNTIQFHSNDSYMWASVFFRSLLFAYRTSLSIPTKWKNNISSSLSLSVYLSHCVFRPCFVPSNNIKINEVVEITTRVKLQKKKNKNFPFTCLAFIRLLYFSYTLLAINCV